MINATTKEIISEGYYEDKKLIEGSTKIFKGKALIYEGTIKHGVYHG